MLLSDRNPEHLRTATGLGAGQRVRRTSDPALVVVAVPPDHLGAEVGARADRDATRSSPTSAASRPPRCAALDGDRRASSRYVGSHPMAGSERSGPLAATADALRRPAVGGHPARRRPTPAAVAAVDALARLAGASVVRLTPEEHDLAVARTSHLPHLLAVLVAGRLADAPAEHLALSGQGVRDVTRIAGGDPALWEQIVTGERRRPSPGC